MLTHANENYFPSFWEVLHHLICLCNQRQHELDPPFLRKRSVLHGAMTTSHAAGQPPLQEDPRRRASFSDSL